MAGSARRTEVTTVLRLLRALTTQTDRYAERRRTELSLSRTDLTAMGVISDGARDGRTLTPGALAQELHLSASAITALLDRLERVGHVSRGRDGTDRRKVVIEITPSAAEVSAEAFRPLSEAIRESLAGYDDAELAVFAQVLSDVVDAVSDVVPDPQPRPPT